ncbi:hypothetical protein MTO96_043953, partial [Rhipicephalus appendiculatus]
MGLSHRSWVLRRKHALLVGLVGPHVPCQKLSFLIGLVLQPRLCRKHDLLVGLAPPHVPRLKLSFLIGLVHQPRLRLKHALLVGLVHRPALPALTT